MTKRFFLYVVCNFISHVFLLEAVDIKGELLLNTVDMGIARSLFKECWKPVYHGLSLQQLGMTDVDKFLDDLFDQEEYDFKNKDHNSRFFFSFLKEDKLIGYISFVIKKEKAVYVKEFAISPEYLKIDLFKKLVFGIFNHREAISCIHINIPTIASLYCNFGKELGFVTRVSDDTKMYTSFQMVFNRCGTCLCEIDDQDLDDEDLEYLCSSFANDPESIDFDYDSEQE
ncbi:GNAT family N-acetyltransferase [Candidatus Dependentiae bacterium]|nr:GNAT family N-acetyltransferase [Candidatus Dependentiae bacterium]